MGRLIAILGVILTLTLPAMAQDLSLEAYASEEELHDAFVAGELDEFQYATLQELIALKADSSSLYLLDEVPNLAFFFAYGRPLSTLLEQDQQQAFFLRDDSTDQARLVWRHSSSVELREESRNRYRSGLQVALGGAWSTDWRFHREYAGYQRIVQRTISYQSSDGKLRRLRLGSFTTRFGLGTILGYRGRLLSRHQELDGENWLFPDYGGHNGLDAQMRIGSHELRLAVTSQRNQEHSVNTAAVLLSRSRGRFRPGLVVGVNRLRSRQTGRTVNDIKFGGLGRYRYSSGHSSAEVTFQAGDRPSFGAIVVEGGHRFQQAQLQYAGWHYDDDYLDIAGGSKAASLRRAIVIDEIDLTISDKRSGQKGMLIKSIVLMNEHTECANSLLWAGRTSDTQRLQFLSSVSIRSSATWTTTIDYLLQRSLQQEPGVIDETVRHRSRIEGRYRSSSLALRLAFAYVTQRQRRDALAILTRLDILEQPWGECELWANLSRIQLSSQRLENAYAFLRLSHRMGRQVQLATRLSHRYARGATNDHETTFSLETVVRL